MSGLLAATEEARKIARRNETSIDVRRDHKGDHYTCATMAPMLEGHSLVLTAHRDGTTVAQMKVISINFRYDATQREDSVLIDDAIDREDAIQKARAWAMEPITILPDDEMINPEAANQ